VIAPFIIFWFPENVVVVPALKVKGFVRVRDPLEEFISCPPFPIIAPELLPKLLVLE